ncbi:hypothetical protein FB001_1706 [Ensifer sp. SEMIA 135]|nr:hypothetical protein Sinme_5120 [Sinorhizobium meliloti AK83]TWA88539.1 hypothetical protein FB000_14924 [Ensifer sp. SEMIA 134]TWB21748.1 hypothetical protein FB001_1706 [Ensifer sp. SEMIA 135]SEJ78286.1 hypothetical protein SAMN04244575_06206 [Sinorhizobium meliloti]
MTRTGDWRLCAGPFSYAAIAASAIAAWSWGGLCKVTIAYVCGIEAGVSMV